MPLRIYFKGRRAKLDLGLARGKKLYDKRDDAKTFGLIDARPPA